MASTPVKRTDTRGRSSWAIQWRYGGTRDGARQTVTLRSLTDARSLKGEVERRGHRVRSSDEEVRTLAIIGKGPKGSMGIGTAPLWPVVAREYMAQVSGQRPATRKICLGVLRMHLSRWDALRVDQITRAHIVALTRDYQMVKGGRGHLNFTLARAVLAYAQRQGYRSDNPAEGIRFESQAEPQHVFWSRDEVELILAAAGTSPRTPDPRFVLMLRLVLGTGLRNGELCGLKRGDFLGLGTADPRLTIQRSVTRLGGRTIEGPTKSGKSRTIELGLETAAMMREYLRGVPRGDTAWVWPAKQVEGQPVSTDNTRWRFSKTLERAERLGLDPSRYGRIQDLRHTHASQLLEQGVSMFAVSLRLGHASIATTQKSYASIGRNEALRSALR